MQIVQILAAVSELPVVLLPGLDGVVVHPGGKQNGLPELFNGSAGSHARKNLFGPGGTGDGGDAPLLLVFPAVHIGLENGISHSVCLGHLLHVDPFHSIGVLGDQMNPGGEGFAVVFLPGLFPLFHGAQVLHAAIAVVELFQRLIVPLDVDLGGLCLVGFLHHHLNEFRLIQVRVNVHNLTFLHVGAAADNQIGILTQGCFVHL